MNGLRKTMREIFHLTKEKIREEDRRFLLLKNSNETLHYEQMLMINKTMFLSILALFLSMLSIILSLDSIVLQTKLISYATLLLIAIILFIQLNNSKRDILSDKKRMEKESAELFKLHFNYAK